MVGAAAPAFVLSLIQHLGHTGIDRVHRIFHIAQIRLDNVNLFPGKNAAQLAAIVAVPGINSIFFAQQQYNKK